MRRALLFAAVGITIGFASLYAFRVRAVDRILRTRLATLGFVDVDLSVGRFDLGRISLPILGGEHNGVRAELRSVEIAYGISSILRRELTGEFTATFIHGGNQFPLRGEYLYDLRLEKGWGKVGSDPLGPADLDSLAKSFAVPVHIAKGLSSAVGQFSWSAEGGPSGILRVVVQGVDGFFRHGTFGGLSGTVFVDPFGGRPPESVLRAAAVDIGVPVEKITASFTVMRDRIVARRVRGEMFGGEVVADDIRWHLRSAENSLQVRASAIDVARLLEFYPQQVVEASGMLTAQLPLRSEGGQPTVSDGTVESVGGGVIRLHTSVETDDSRAQMTEALRNYEYDTLRAAVNYTADGALLLGVELKGRSVNLGRAVHVNIRVEENVPKLLESLRVARAVSDEIERAFREGR